MPGFGVNAQNSSSYPDYTIRPGDSLGYIANLFGTTIEEIVNLNNLTNPDLISPGQIIKIPSFAGYAGNLNLVATGVGETYSMLPVKYSTDVQTLVKLNNLLSPTQVYAGSELILIQPSDELPLIPIAKVDSKHTFLESAIRNNLNPFSLAMVNQLPGYASSPSGSVIFWRSSSSVSELSLFAPDFKKVIFTPLPLSQGITVSITLNSDQQLKLTGEIDSIPIVFFSDDVGSYYALQGIHAMAKPGLVDFTIKAVLPDGEEHTYSQQILLVPGLFDEDPPLNVDPATIDPAVTQPENELVRSIISNITLVRYWNEKFTSPAYYQEYNSLFGTRRKYNDDPNQYFHTGVDFAGGMTLPITAPAPGKVVFAGPLTVRGNAVFIDHGWGVYSGFFHQDTILVKVGEMVETGQQIGTVGNSGRVNGAGDYQGAGAHLHWELWVNGVQVDPLDWLSIQYPSIE